MMRFRTVLLLGAPGSGKGTQGKMLAARPGFRHVACGDVFRALDKNSPMGQAFAKFATGGGLVPDSLTVELWRQTMTTLIESKQFDPANHILLLDGIPRTVDQAALMTDTIDVIAIIHLFVNDVSQIVQRLQARAARENRADDTDIEIIRHRLDVYEEQTRPVLEYYPRGRIFRVNATQPPQEVAADIMRVLGPLRACF